MMLNFTAQDIQGQFTVTYSVNKFFLHMVKDFGDVLIGGYYDKDTLNKDIKQYGLKNVTFHGIAVRKYLGA